MRAVNEHHHEAPLNPEKMDSKPAHERDDLRATTNSSFSKQEPQYDSESEQEEILIELMESKTFLRSRNAAEKTISEDLDLLLRLMYPEIQPGSPRGCAGSTESEIDEIARDPSPAAPYPVGCEEVGVMTCFGNPDDMQREVRAECIPCDQRQAFVWDPEDMYDPVRRLLPPYPIPPPRRFARRPQNKLNDTLAAGSPGSSDVK